jgi:RNA polymerase sigma factor (sigma-70 family)
MASNGRPALRGDEQELFRSLSKRLLRSVGWAVNAPEAIVEEACAFAWQRLIECQPERTERIFAWLRKVAIHEAWRLVRRERVAVRLDEPASDGGGLEVHELVPDERASLESYLEAVEALEQVAALPPRQRRLFALQIAGLSYAETSALTGDSVRTVDRQLRRAHAGVRHRRWQQAR